MLDINKSEREFQQRHNERLEYAKIQLDQANAHFNDTTHKFISINYAVNGAAIIAILSFIGATGSKPSDGDTWMLYVALGLFIIGVANCLDIHRKQLHDASQEVLYALELKKEVKALHIGDSYALPPKPLLQGKDLGKPLTWGALGMGCCTAYIFSPVMDKLIEYIPELITLISIWIG